MISRHIWNAAPETNSSRSGGANFAAKCNKVFFTLFSGFTFFPTLWLEEIFLLKVINQIF